jgi:hypothetical protein
LSKKNRIIQVKDIDISITTENEDDFICLTDLAKAKDGESRAADIIKNWIRSRTTLEYLGTWEQIYNPDFKVVEFDHFKMQAGLPTFVLSPGQWVEKTNAIGIIVKSGRYGGTYAHKDIAFEFCSAISPVFKIYLIKEFQRLKKEEDNKYNLEWNVSRILSKVNYSIHTDAIKENLIPPTISSKDQAIIYASEADMLNKALFGKTAGQWRNENPEKEGNIRDFATLEQLVVLSNLESLNAMLIHNEIPQWQRLLQLNIVAIQQLKVLINSVPFKKLKEGK